MSCDAVNFGNSGGRVGDCEGSLSVESWRVEAGDATGAR